MNQEGKWKMLTVTPEQSGLVAGAGTHDASIKVGSSIWFESFIFDSEKQKGYRGLAEYRTDSNTTSSMVGYPTAFGSVDQDTIYCKHKDNFIVIIGVYSHCAVVDLENTRCKAIVFDTRTREYSAPFTFPGRFDTGSLYVVIGDFLHIHRTWYSTQRDKSGDYIICSLTDKSSQNFRGHCSVRLQPNLCGGHVIKTNDCYQSSNPILISGFARMQIGIQIPLVIVHLISKYSIFELFKFGGWDMNGSKAPEHVNPFYVGTLRNGNPKEPIEWKLTPQYNLKYPWNRPGYVHYGPFILTFGGRKGGFGEDEWVDGIRILDLHKNCGWVESPIKCPQKDQYHAILDDMERIHLFASTKSQAHFWIDLADVIPQLTED